MHQPGRDGGPWAAASHEAGTPPERNGGDPGPPSPQREETRCCPARPTAASTSGVAAAHDARLGRAADCAGLCPRLDPDILWEWRLTYPAGTAEIVVSELTTNSVLASRSLDRLATRLILLSDSLQLVVLVRDLDPRCPYSTPRRHGRRKRARAAAGRVPQRPPRLVQARRRHIRQSGMGSSVRNVSFRAS
jgi:hypothetical protein